MLMKLGSHLRKFWPCLTAFVSRLAANYSEMRIKFLVMYSIYYFTSQENGISIHSMLFYLVSVLLMWCFIVPAACSLACLSTCSLARWEVHCRVLLGVRLSAPLAQDSATTQHHSSASDTRWVSAHLLYSETDIWHSDTCMPLVLICLPFGGAISLNFPGSDLSTVFVIILCHLLHSVLCNTVIV